ncbi:type II toxin-antitoxin system VapC family toxin [Pararhizobium sp. YC-54]|uniref:type II toxin-antitoxin system VapC family toxin n=1 Tax=Pararhizobium sp. YC-54 TaxID=2986920 RepID=UPI0021F7FF6D|nr:type II toxin-antitoxin system VapC family toxin [Pararhizobium sp. YC-54]MCV9999851.1 type II toxin-antitoxin system VapC family toxin [Pararhizobium sp. YC-54]
MRMTEGYLLDTCAMIWATQLAPMSKDVTVLLNAKPHDRRQLNISAMSAWEIGMLVAKGRLATTKNALIWFADFAKEADVAVLDVTPELLVTSSFLPAPIHNDPTDRIIIATAREHDLTIITRDRAILAYGAAGHVKTLVC